MDVSKLEYLKKHYAYDEWRDNNRLNENLLIWKFFPGENELPGWQPRRIQRVAMPDVEKRDVPASIQSLWQQVDGKTEILLRADTFECDSRTHAHAYLLRVLGGFQSPLLKRTEAVAGDVAFTFPGETVILFARANLVCLLRNAGRKAQSLAPLARQLDETLISKPEVEGQRGVVKIQQLRFDDQDLKAGSIALDVSESEEQQWWYKFFSSSGEVRLEQERPIYLSKSSGSNKVTIYIIQPKRHISITASNHSFNPNTR